MKRRGDAFDGRSDTFCGRLWAEAARKQSWICLGLDVELARLPDEFPRTIDGARDFLMRVIDVCAEDVVAFKPNVPFYTGLGPAGWKLLEEVVSRISETAISIVDWKVGDVANTSRQYADTIFDGLQSDAVTINAYGGRDAVMPLIDRADRGVFVWTRSSNPGADEFQGLPGGGGEPLFVTLARRVAAWDKHGNLGLVVAATHAEDVTLVRAAAPSLPMLLPGVGAQGGDLETSVANGFGAPPAGVLVNLGRSALWASSGADFAEVTRRELRRAQERVEAAISSVTTSADQG